MNDNGIIIALMDIPQTLHEDDQEALRQGLVALGFMAAILPVTSKTVRVNSDTSVVVNRFKSRVLIRSLYTN